MYKLLLPVILVAACALPAATASGAEASGVSLVSAPQDKPTPKPKPTKDKPTSAKGGNPPAHSNGLGTANAPGQVKKAGADPGTGTGGGDDNADPQADNQNEKVTYCHVPPGNADNGHVITTSVRAVSPGHTNHPGDIIPPFSYVWGGELISFPGQNWGPDAQAIIDNGCALTDGSATDPGQVAGAQAVADTEAAAADPALLDQLLPDTGGARLALLLGAVALLAGGLILVGRRRAGATHE